METVKEDEALKEVPVVVLTGLTQYQQFYQSDFPQDALPDAFVEKPIQQDSLLKIVQGLIGEADTQGD